jgi:hypothetical protein
MPTLPNVLTADGAEAMIRRLNTLTPTTPPQWGKMTVDQMLAHCLVSYDMVYTTRYPKPNPLMRLVLRLIVKAKVTGPEPYARSSPTAPIFRIQGARNFAEERDRLIANIRRVAEEGASRFEGRVSHSFGPLTAAEWNTLFAKHLDHHLAQFGV